MRNGGVKRTECNAWIRILVPIGIVHQFAGAVVTFTRFVASALTTRLQILIWSYSRYTYYKQPSLLLPLIHEYDSYTSVLICSNVFYIPLLEKFRFQLRQTRTGTGKSLVPVSSNDWIESARQNSNYTAFATNAVVSILMSPPWWT